MVGRPTQRPKSITMDSAFLVTNGQRIQVSGVARRESLTLTTDTAQKMAGKWNYDGSASGMPKIDVEFDVTLMKEFAKAR